jgi:lipopolysaccharide biosynthesis glycosyltransferase
MDIKNVVFAVNKGFICYLMVALRTLGRNNNYPINIHLIYSNLNQRHLNQIAKICHEFHYNFKPIKINKSLFEGAPEMGHLKFEAYYRLAIPNIIDANCVLYLDCDILIRSNISELFEINLDSYAIAAVEDPVYNPRQTLKMKTDSRFFNSGILMMNLDYWRQNNLSKIILDFAIENHNLLKCADQCALNAIIGLDYIALNKIYNYQSHLMKFDEKYINGLISAKIIHFTGPFKPTHYLCKHPYKDLYLNELKLISDYQLFIFKHIIINTIRILLKKLYLESLPSNLKKFRFLE